MLGAGRRQRGRARQAAAAALVADSRHRERGLRQRLLVLPHPGGHRAGEARIFQRINQIHIRGRRHGQREILHRLLADLVQKRIELEFDRLGGSHPIEMPVVAGEHLQQRQVGIVADAEHQRVRPLRRRAACATPPHTRPPVCQL